jgi:hypothetical protein
LFGNRGSGWLPRGLFCGQPGIGLELFGLSGLGLRGTRVIVRVRGLALPGNRGHRARSAWFIGASAGQLFGTRPGCRVNRGSAPGSGHGMVHNCSGLNREFTGKARQLRRARGAIVRTQVLPGSAVRTIVRPPPLRRARQVAVNQPAAGVKCLTLKSAFFS